MPRRHVREWRYSATILDVGTRWRRMVSIMTRPLYSRGKSPWYSFNRRLGGPQSRSGSCDVEKSLLPLPRIEPWPSSRQAVAMPTEPNNIWRKSTDYEAPHYSVSSTSSSSSAPNIHHNTLFSNTLNNGKQRQPVCLLCSVSAV
jgi:hypothetical protein